MAPKKQPSTLNALCLKWISNQLIHALSDEEVKHLNEVQVYMDSATYDTLQGLLSEILGMINLDANIRFSCLQVLLRADVKHLEIGIFPRFYYDQILIAIRDQGKGLSHLNLKGVWARDYSQLLRELVLSLRRLKVLIIPHMSDDSVINAILSLKHLVKLDISGEACYSSSGIRLLKSDTLRVLDIGSFGKVDLCQDATNGCELVADIIANLPNLNVLKTYSFTGHALLHLYKKDNNFRTKLTYLHTTDCDLDILNAIVATSPYLENAHFNCPQEQVVSGMGAIKHLHALKLTRGNSVEFKTFLQAAGLKLQALKLNNSRNANVDLSDLCEDAPHLTTLECYQAYLSYTNPDSFYMNLQKVQISYCDITDTVVKTLLTNAPFLKSMTIGSNVEMTDGDMFRLLGECSLENMEELILSDARYLTAVTVQLLAENCPKLRILGSLTSWDISPEEVDALRLLITLSNTDLTLWPTTF